MYHIRDQPQNSTNETNKNKMIIFDEDEIEMLTKAETLMVLTVQQQLDLLAVDEKIEKEKKKNIFDQPDTKYPNLPFDELVDLNAAMFDDRSLYLKPKVSILVPVCKQEQHKELVCKMETCQNIYLNMVYQLIHTFGSRMTFQPHLELSKLERSFEKAELSEELKNYVRNLGKVTYDILVYSEVLGNPIELDVNQSVGVKYNEENRLITTHIDVVTSSAQDSKGTSDSMDDISKASEDYTYSFDDNSASLNESLESTNLSHESLGNHGNETFNSDSNISYSEEFEDSATGIPFKSNHQRAAISFLLTPRQSIPIEKIFHQHLASMGHQDLTMYLCVCHLGPLVDNQVVLYEYRSRVAGKPIEGSDINEVMKSWTRLQGRLVFPVTPIEDLVKHSIYRYEGLSKKKKEKKRRKVIKLYID